MSEKKIQIGGLAVIEGVMMRGPDQLATAIRKKDGSICIQKKAYVSVTKTHPVYKLPIIRGFVSIIEMLKIGMETLNYSAKIWETDNIEEVSETSSFRKKLEEVLPIIVAIVLALLFFGYLPYLISSFLGLAKQNILFNLVSGTIRIAFFVVYVYCISFMKDIKRVFEYHGAEHKAVFAHENKAPLTVESVRSFSTIHPRCGTSFMFFVLLVAIFVFSILDTFVAIYYFVPTPLVRFLYHIPFIPLISGISYEILKLSESKMDNPLIRLFTKPGMALQKFTTQQPDDKQIEVAIAALSEALTQDTE